jgi:hypothetical protein
MPSKSQHSRVPSSTVLYTTTIREHHRVCQKQAYQHPIPASNADTSKVHYGVSCTSVTYAWHCDSTMMVQANRRAYMLQGEQQTWRASMERPPRRAMLLLRDMMATVCMYNNRPPTAALGKPMCEHSQHAAMCNLQQPHSGSARGINHPAHVQAKRMVLIQVLRGHVGCSQDASHASAQCTRAHNALSPQCQTHHSREPCCGILYTQGTARSADGPVK